MVACLHFMCTQQRTGSGSSACVLVLHYFVDDDCGLKSLCYQMHMVII